MESLPPDHLEQARERKRLRDLGGRSYERFYEDAKKPLDAEQEIASYIGSWDSLHRNSIETLQQDLAKTELAPETTTHVIMPVAGRDELSAIEHTLSQYAKQDADPNTWTLVLFLNVVDDSPEYGGIDPVIIKRISEFTAQHPHLQVQTTSTTYLDEAPPIGAIRADAWDAVLQDIHERGIETNHSIGISHDADAKWIASNYISTMQQAVRDEPEKDAFTCKLSWHNEGDSSSDPNKILRYWEHMSNVARHNAGRVITSDANTAVRLSTYAAIGGYDRTRSIAETIYLLETISIARRLPYKSTEHVAYLSDTSLKTDSRRIYHAIACGLPPDYSWINQYRPFATGDDSVRTRNIEAMASVALSSRVLESILRTTDEIAFRGVSNIEKAEKMRDFGRSVIGLPAVNE